MILGNDGHNNRAKNWMPVFRRSDRGLVHKLNVKVSRTPKYESAYLTSKSGLPGHVYSLGVIYRPEGTSRSDTRTFSVVFSAYRLLRQNVQRYTTFGFSC
jgi:Tfp pilus assembly protein PilX